MPKLVTLYEKYKRVDTRRQELYQEHHVQKFVTVAEHAKAQHKIRHEIRKHAEVENDKNGTEQLGDFLSRTQQRLVGFFRGVFLREPKVFDDLDVGNEDDRVREDVHEKKDGRCKQLTLPAWFQDVYTTPGSAVAFGKLDENYIGRGKQDRQNPYQQKNKLEAVPRHTSLEGPHYGIVAFQGDSSQRKN